MHCLPAQRAFTCICLSLASLTFGIPQVAFPVNSQTPPVAYVAQPYDFTFSPTTFTSNSGEISYHFSDQPTWLSFNGATRTITGTPTVNDVGAPSFELVAADTSGETTSNITLVVLSERTLIPRNEVIISQLATAGGVSAPASLLSHPQQAFDFSLTRSLFNGITTSTVFYALSGDGSPLPSWIQFDSQALRFSGTTPPLLAPDPSEQAFSFQLVATSVAGFSEASIEFEIQISDHVLAFSQPGLEIVATPNASLQISSLLSNFTIDGSVVQRDQLASVSTDLPPWLNFNSNDLSFEGFVPANAENLSLSLLVRGIDANTVNVTISIVIEGSQKGAELSLGTARAETGSYFTYTITKPTNLTGDLSAEVETSDLPDWLSFNATNLTLAGQVPTRALVEVRSIDFVFRTNSSNMTAALSLVVVQSTTSTDNTTPTSSPSSSSDSTADMSSKKQMTIILATLLPVFVIVILLCLLSVCVRNRREARMMTGGKQRPTRNPPSESRGMETDNVNEESARETTPLSDGSMPSPSSVPQIELNWPREPAERTRKRLSKKLRTSNHSAAGSSWDDLIEFQAQSVDNLPSEPTASNQDRKYSGFDVVLPSPVLKIGRVQPLMPVRELDSRQAQNRRRSTSARPTTTHFVGLPKRMSGMGHGMELRQSLTTTHPRSSWQTTTGSLSVVDGQPNTFVLRAFPAPPPRGSIGAVPNISESSPQGKAATERTVRLVASTSDDTRSSVDDVRRRQSTHRTSHQHKDKLPADKSAQKPTSRYDRASELNSSRIRRMVGESTRFGHGGEGIFEPPPIPQRSLARLGTGRVRSMDDESQNPPASYNKGRKPSSTSSNQFGSAVSSESQWEDEDVVVDEAAEEHAQGSAVWQISRSPLEPYSPAERNSSKYRRGLNSEEPRLADQRKQIYVNEHGLQPSQNSQKRSSRFI